MPHDRSSVAMGPFAVTKTYGDIMAADAEASWYRAVPWATPKLLTHDGAVLVIERCLPVEPSPTAYAELVALLTKLHAHGVAHRDVHVRNVVRQANGGGIRLIDWETACRIPPGAGNYDLDGPDVSGVAVPDIHAERGLAAQWVGAGSRYSIGRAWASERKARPL